jgi:hypothetical protein
VKELYAATVKEVQPGTGKEVRAGIVKAVFKRHRERMATINFVLK